MSNDNGLPSIADSVKSCVTDLDCDLFTYSGRIYSRDVSRFMSFILHRKKHDNLSLVLTTYGGDAHAAYRLARFCQSFYKSIRILIVGPCKSAGTLVVLCGNELVFGPFGELGPLDIQVYKKDDLMSLGSGLDTFQALAILQTHAYSTFEAYLENVLDFGEGAISTVTACEIASRLVTGLFAPIAAQIDPQKMGEMQRSISIAKAYGERIGLHNMRKGALTALVEDYPSHGFIIDHKEASKLFRQVKWMSQEEVVLVTTLEEKGYCTLTPGDATIFADASTLLSSESEGDSNEGTTGSAENIGADGEGEPGNTKPPEGAGGQTAGTGRNRSRTRSPSRATRAS